MTKETLLLYLYVSQPRKKKCQKTIKYFIFKFKDKHITVIDNIEKKKHFNQVLNECE